MSASSGFRSLTPPPRQTSWLLPLGLAIACGGEQGTSAQAGDSGPSPDAGHATVADAQLAAPSQDAAPPYAEASLPQPDTGAASGCALGSAGSFATERDLDLFGDIVYFADAQTLPAGRYRVTYEDGCMKYNLFLPWTVNQGGNDGWWLVGETRDRRVAQLPGIVASGNTGSSFDGCLAAARDVQPFEFDFTGGKLGIVLFDGPYIDNVAGEAGRNPKWSLTLLVDACPPELILR
jgi:hypothetical protein